MRKMGGMLDLNVLISKLNPCFSLYPSICLENGKFKRRFSLLYKQVVPILMSSIIKRSVRV